MPHCSDIYNKSAKKYASSHWTRSKVKYKFLTDYQECLTNALIKKSSTRTDDMIVLIFQDVDIIFLSSYNYCWIRFPDVNTTFRSSMLPLQTSLSEVGFLKICSYRVIWNNYIQTYKSSTVNINGVLIDMINSNIFIEYWFTCKKGGGGDECIAGDAFHIDGPSLIF